ncbi:MAG: AAA family ATPase [Desulfuromonadaceae bacterium]|nr:AAA family ATPase [Desulfuromonadaceae bacterium]
MKIDFNQWGHTDERKEIDFAQIKAISVNHIVAILEHWQPGGKVINGEYLCGSKEGGKGESCSTNVRSGVGSDFATGESWGDTIDMVAKIEGVSMSDAARKLQDFLSIGPGDPHPTPIIPQQSPDERYEAGRKIALALWVESESCPHTHPYLIKKQINADQGIRLHPPTGNILIPLDDGNGTMWSVQRISPDGEKKINSNGKLSGNFYLIAGERDTVYICEGYATAQTVAMVTGKTAVVAVNTGNLESVGEKISRMFPSSHLVFAADNDNVTPKIANQIKNPGMTMANKAVKAIGRGIVIAPPTDPETKLDWNDYAITNGAKAARELLAGSKRSQVFVDIKTVALIEPQFLIEDVIETPCTGMVFGPSGGGKSFFVLDMLFHIACGKKWLGKQVKQGPAFYVCGEGRHAIPRRLKAWETSHKTQLPYNSFLMSSARVDFSPESVRDMTMEIDQLHDQVGAPAVIVIDTMARALPGDADENSSKDVGSFIDECDRLQTKYNCVVLIVHHTGHADSASKRARGSSAIKGAMDVEILISKDRTVEWTKTKDMEPHPTIKFDLVTVQYGEGKREHSCVLKYDLEWNSSKAKAETAYRKAARQSLADAIAADDIGGKCCADTWTEHFCALFPDKSRRALRSALFRQDGGEIVKMVEAGEVEQDGKYYSMVQSEKQVTETMFKGIL